MIFTVTSHATSANIGPGFDCMGICLNKANIMSFAYRPQGIIVDGVTSLAKNESHLVVQSFYYGLDKLGAKRPAGFEINMDSQVPISRGMGSSACCIGGGLAFAYLHAKGKLDKDKIFEWATEMEGHPDNVGPNVYGGALLCYNGSKGYEAIRFHIDRKFRFIAMIPDFKLSTKAARAALPEAYTREETVFNMSHAALLIKAFERGDSRLLREAMQDKLHQQYRAPMITGYKTAVDIAIKAGAVGTYISGAGPCIMAVADSPSVFPRIRSLLNKQLNGWQADAMRLSHEGLKATISESGAKSTPLKNGNDTRK